MSPLDIRAGVRRLFRLDVRRPRDAGADADLELGVFIDEQIQYLMARGWPRDAAQAEALRRLGRPPADARAQLHRSAQQRERRMRLHQWLDDAAADIRFAGRTLRRSPGLATAAIATLALAIGANTAIFSAVSAVLLRPLPFAAPERLVMLWEENPDFNWYQQDAAPANYLDWREQAGVFTDVAAYASWSGQATLTGRGEPRLLSTRFITGNLFSVLGVRPVHGRDLSDQETWAGAAPPAVMVSWRAWRDVFGSDRSLVGRTITLGGRAVELAGVLPEQFTIPGADVDLWLPFRWDPASRAQVFFRRAHWLDVIARLEPGVTHERAGAALQTVVKRLQQQYPETNTRMGAGLTPLHEFLVGSTKTPLLTMLGAVAVLLLIACANVANLLLVRAAGREHEFALRLALGAGAGRLLRQALAEVLVLAIAGGGAGVALGWWGTGALGALLPAGMLPVRGITMSWIVVGYAFAATAFCAALFGIAPALWTRRRVPADVLREEGRTASGGLRARRWGDALLVGQVALALALTLGAGLLVRSYLLLQRVDPGFDGTNVLAVEIALPGFRYDSTRKVLAFYDELERRARALPGVEAAAVVSQVPLGPPTWSSEFGVQGREPLPRGSEVRHRELTHEYQQVMRVPLKSGRRFNAADMREEGPLVVLINETLARKYFPDRDPLGARIIFDRIPAPESRWRTIVGVVGDERQTGLGTSAFPEILAPVAQEPRNRMTLVVRSRAELGGIAAPVRRVVADLDPDLAITSIRTMDAVRAESLARDRFLTVLMVSFAGVGLGLGLVGVYGVVAQLARRRTRELGIRVALGARGAQLQWLVVRHGVGLTAAGVAIGLAIAAAVTQGMRTLLYQVAPIDPVTFVAVPVLVLLTAAAAAWLPAVRASRADPCQVLRTD
jgi:putative ABC transport system permease protein